MSNTEEKIARATKKVKSREEHTVEEEVVMEDVSGSENSLSFREALMSNQGFRGTKSSLKMNGLMKTWSKIGGIKMLRKWNTCNMLFKVLSLKSLFRMKSWTNGARIGEGP